MFLRRLSIVLFILCVLFLGLGIWFWQNGRVG
ncbi:hypothetical protein C7459_11830 [Tumebacillus permanentifrigoris]|jgi:hypothetical protein|uniref:Uncharacterized protein n=1 Tax=Tumebacillus permanentifrigoris TaxID=378543 RepID=A0A316DR89_9BACL|nr:hypothetical protein C7459_11830 [Tumebacillus permanentifrigoris]